MSKSMEFRNRFTSPTTKGMRQKCGRLIKKIKLNLINFGSVLERANKTVEIAIKDRNIIFRQQQTCLHTKYKFNERDYGDLV